MSDFLIPQARARSHSYGGEGGDKDPAAFFTSQGLPNPFSAAERLKAMEAAKKEVQSKLKRMEGPKAELTITLSSTDIKPSIVKSQFAVYRGKYNAVVEASKNCLTLLLQENDDEEYDKLSNRIDKEETEFLQLECQVEEILNASSSQSSQSSSSSPQGCEYQTKFPTRELVKFSGDVRGWLAFEAFFKPIHEDKNLKEVDKFHILISCMVKDSDAEKLIGSYPVSSENYNEAYASLKERYGRENVLVKVYVRELLKLVVENASGKKANFIEVVTQLSSQVRNLIALGVTEDKCAQVLYPVVESCLPDDTMIAWQRSQEYKEELNALIDFLQTEVNRQTERKLAKSQFGNMSTTPSTSTKHSGKSNKSSAKAVVDATTSFAASSQGSKACVFCDRDHSSADCRSAQHIDHSKKSDILKSKKCCLTCLKPGHYSKNCKINLKCALCSKRHYLVMCPLLDSNADSGTQEDTNKQNTNRDTPQIKKESPSPTSSSNLKNSVRSMDVPLQTLITTAYGTNGTKRRVRIMFDSGSQKSYILSHLAKDLNLGVTGKEVVTHDLFGGQARVLNHDIVRLHLGNGDGSAKKQFDVRCIDVIAANIISPRCGPWIQAFAKRGAVFSDFGHAAGKVDILIGNDIRPHCFTGNKIILYDGPGPVAEETIWGWVLSGKLPAENIINKTSTMTVTNLHVADRPISDLWSLETIGIRDSGEKETRKEMDEKTIAHFKQSVKQLEDGRYEVALPWLQGMKDKLPNNYFACVRRLKNTCNKLKQSGYLEKYHSVFLQWEKDKMIEKVNLDEQPHLTEAQYLPHRAVIKPNNETTPVRPVFDASAKLRGHPSLNDCVDKGANTLELIPSILTRFRLHKYGVIADIRKAFQQISVKPEDRDYLRFLWYEDSNCQQQVIYRHTRVVFGVSASPFLLGITLKHHLELQQQMSTLSTKHVFYSTLLANMYVDNVVVSLPSIELAHQFQQNSEEALLKARFELRGWELGPNDSGKDIPVLGLLWSTRDDTLRLDLAATIEKLKETKYTQRFLLSLAHSLFDPLGFISPFVLGAKLLLRQCHEEKVGWDSILPTAISKELNKWTSQIIHLDKVRIPRYTFFGDNQGNVSFHVFCDASSAAYAAAVFMRVEIEDDVKLHLIQSRSRVAPKKTTTIPRLELISCLVGARLYQTISEDIGQSKLPVTFWTDSSTALAWIRGHGPWGVFVNNRKQEINKLTESNSWRHIPGRFNPADLPSRGCGAVKLIDSKWWEGPRWLLQHYSLWPSSSAKPDPVEVEAELKKTVVTCLASNLNHPFEKLLRFSSYNQILRTIAYWLRFISWIRNKAELDWKAPLSMEEIEKAEFHLLKYIQQPLHQNPQHLKRLRPFEDIHGVLHTRTRLIHEDEDTFKNPIILPNNNKFVDLLIFEEHRLNCHIGTEMLLAHLRERFWIIQGRRNIRKVINTCWICRRFLARPIQVPEAPLPAARTQLGYPFEVTGIDAAGPLLLKKKQKVWILLFTCALYRAIHLEVVETLSTEGFLRALRHFVARRARPRIIYSDNALNFVGAHRITASLDWKQVEEYAHVNRIEWRFNPPTAPWWGGFWERMIGMVKGLLRRMLGKRVVHFPELVSLCIEIEEAINNRPLTYLTEDPDDPQPLTPNQFVKNLAIPSTLPEADALDSKSLRAAFRKLQRLREALRSRFRKEYLGQLLNYKHSQKLTKLKDGDVVLIEHDNMKRQDWPMAVVISSIPGRDGMPRAYNLKTRGGEVTRPAQRLFPMEVPEEESSSLRNKHLNPV